MSMLNTPGPQRYASVGQTYSKPPAGGLAISALVLGVLAVIFFWTAIGGSLAGVAAVILGIVALVKAAKAPQQYGGRGMAIAGLCTGAVGLVLGIAASVWYFSVINLFSGQMSAGMYFENMALADIDQAIQSYSQQNGGQRPASLQVLIDGGYADPMLLANQSGITGNRVTDYAYVADLEPDAPGKWIVAYSDPAMRGDGSVVVLRFDSTIEVLTATEFEAELDQFIAEHEDKYGIPPAIIEPH